MSAPLTYSEWTSSAWEKVKERCVERIELLRSQLEGNLDPIETADRRGRIAEVRSLMAMDKPPKREAQQQE